MHDRAKTRQRLDDHIDRHGKNHHQRVADGFKRLALVNGTDLEARPAPGSRQRNRGADQPRTDDGETWLRIRHLIPLAP